MKKRVITFFIIFSFLWLSLITFNSNCSANGQSQEQLKIFTEKYGKDVKIRYDNTGRPIRIRNIKTAESVGKPEDIALSFLTENSSFLDINLANLKFIKRRETKQVNTAVFQQIYKDLPVQDKVVRVNLTKNGKITFVKSNYYPHADLDIVPQITAEAAAAVIMSDLGVEELLQVIKTATGYSYKDEFSSPVPELVIIPGKEKGKAQLAWKFHFTQKDTSHCWYYGIDAHTGEIIVKSDTTRDWSVDGNVDGDIYPTDGDDDTDSEELENLLVTVQRYNYGWINSGDDYTNDSGNYYISYPSYYLYHRILAGTIGSKCDVFNSYTSDAAYIIAGDWYPYCPDTNFDLDYNPSSSYSDFDCVNAYHHINESLEEYYEDNWGYDLGYDIEVYTHYYDSSGEGHDCAFCSLGPNPFIALGHGYIYTKNAAHARDIMLHELQHVVTDEIYYPNMGSDIFMYSLDEAYSDYFAGTQTNDPEQGEWYVNDPNYVRDLLEHVTYNNDWDKSNDPHIKGLVMSHPFWHIRTELGQSEADDIIFCSIGETPDNWNDLYDALTCVECNPDYSDEVEDILDAHWAGAL